MTTAALVLSGGASTRYGGYPKALLQVDGATAIERVCDRCLDRGFDPVVVVAGPHHGPIAHALRGRPVTVVAAERWHEGRTASMQAGLEAIPEDRDLLFWPIDHPFPGGRAIDRLLAARDADALAVWFIPTFEERGGHPVLWRALLRSELFALRSDAPIRSLIPEFGPQVGRVAVDDPGVVANVDTPEEFASALEAWRRREPD